ncbi:MAG: HAD-IC family P-type ATPase, partial [Gammaproteobacteria bacterium]|nr:HAD-IC family P-type ATPase [Gammaproteobacteria bacterium]
VIREGKKVRVPSSQIVPGDLVVLASGDKVPADLRLVKVRDFRVDESSLTGESLPVEKQTATLEADTILPERTNMAYGGTLVSYGSGTGIVIAIGNGTETGKIATMIAEAVTLKTPLTKKIAKFSTILLYAILVLAAFTFLVGIMRDQPAFDMFMAAVALAVGAIPEGLPAAVTITLAIGVNRMAKRKAIVRKLPAVETLGSTTVICSDKTGTLTENQMTVQAAWIGGKAYSAEGQGYHPEGRFVTSADGGRIDGDNALERLLIAGALCNDASISMEETGHWKFEGDPTEAALLFAAKKGGVNREEAENAFPRIDAIPFESDRMYMATLHPEAEGPVAFVKGSLERVSAMCTTMATPDGHTTPIDYEMVQRAAERLASRGMRVLAFAQKRLPQDQESLSESDVAEEMIFLGLQAMIDPPRKEAVTAVAACKRAGVRVKMITGDHAKTAAAIAHELGLEGDREDHGELRVVNGRELAAMSDSDLLEIVEKVAVFARVAPDQKLRLVDALQENGQVVAMTGDGVNDAPALKQADIGVAMGKAGTEVAKEAADIVLTDDNFATIEAAVEEGRGVFDNLTKFIVWTLPTNLGEGLVILAAIMAGIALPILPVQILWINMTTAVLLGMTLAFEPKEQGIMQRQPRDPKASILTGELIGRMVLVAIVMLVGAFGLFWWELTQGASEEVARTVAVNVFVVIEIFYLFNCRSLHQPLHKIGFFSNPWAIGGAISMLSLQLIFTYAPFMNRFFQTAPLPGSSWVAIFGFGLLAFLLVLLEKWIRTK